MPAVLPGLWLLGIIVIALGLVFNQRVPFVLWVLCKNLGKLGRQVASKQN
ncbi:MAG: hypothetical protein ACK4QL_10045 [Pseudanabaenaceae cyanobacterium]